MPPTAGCALSGRLIRNESKFPYRRVAIRAAQADRLFRRDKGRWSDGRVAGPGADRPERLARPSAATGQASGGDRRRDRDDRRAGQPGDPPAYPALEGRKPATMSIAHLEIRQKVITYAHKLQAERLVYSTAGNISVRVPGQPDLLEPADIAIVTLDGEQVDGRKPATSEVAMHTLICKNRPEVGGVVHTHGKAVMTFANLGWTLPPILTGLCEATGGAVYTSPYSQPETDQMYTYTVPALRG